MKKHRYALPWFLIVFSKLVFHKFFQKKCFFWSDALSSILLQQTWQHNNSTQTIIHNKISNIQLLSLNHFCWKCNWRILQASTYLRVVEALNKKFNVFFFTHLNDVKKQNNTRMSDLMIFGNIIVWGKLGIKHSLTPIFVVDYRKVRLIIHPTTDYWNTRTLNIESKGKLKRGHSDFFT